MKSNLEIMTEARLSLTEKWSFAIITFLVLSLILIGATLIPIPGTPLSFILSGPLMIGAAYIALKIYKNEGAETNDLFFGFNYLFGNSIVAYLLMNVLILVRLLLLIVPGVIAALAYSQTFFILAENPSMDPYEAILKSKKMMRGFKWQYFQISLILFGLGVLCLLTFGIGFLWLIPYKHVVYANFYEKVKAATI